MNAKSENHEIILISCGTTNASERTSLLAERSKTGSSSGKSNRFFGSMLVIGSSLSVGLLVLFLHVAERVYHLPPMSTMFVLSFCMLLWSICYILIFVDVKKLARDMTMLQWTMVVLRGLFSAIGLTFFILGLKFIPVGDANSITSFSPFFAMLLGYFFLGEPITYFHAAMGVLCALGAFLIAHPSFLMMHDASHLSLHDRAIGSVLVLLDAFSTAGASTALRKVAIDVHPALPVFFYGAFGSVISSLLGFPVLFSEIIHRKQATLTVVLASPFMFAADILWATGLKYSSIGRARLLLTLNIPFVYVLDSILFKEQYIWPSILGALLIIISSALTSFRG